MVLQLANPTVIGDNIIVKDNVFNKHELTKLFLEMEYWAPRLGSPDSTRASTNTYGARRKSGRGVFLDGLYPNRNLSDILDYTTRHTFNSISINDTIDTLAEKDLYWQLWKYRNFHSTLLQYYENGDHYDFHVDHSLFTVIYTFFNADQNNESLFRGGHLAIKDGTETHIVACLNNRMVLFPSQLEHSVQEMYMPKHNLPSHMGRFSVAQLVSWHPERENG